MEFSFQKWPVYRESIAIAKEANSLCAHFSKAGNRSLSDQLRRASQSIALNIAEGTSRASKKDKINFLRVAQGSLFECAAVSDLGAQIGLLKEADREAFQKKLVNVGRMLSAIVRHFEGG